MHPCTTTDPEERDAYLAQHHARITSILEDPRCPRPAVLLVLDGGTPEARAMIDEEVSIGCGPHGVTLALTTEHAAEVFADVAPGWKQKLLAPCLGGVWTILWLGDALSLHALAPSAPRGRRD